jgi:DNA-directed RNA polymerase sigma subunit (sigma70/sigma32)
MTLEKIGQLFGVRRARIWHIESRAIRQIRKSR